MLPRVFDECYFKNTFLRVDRKYYLNRSVILSQNAQMPTNKKPLSHPTKQKIPALYTNPSFPLSCVIKSITMATYNDLQTDQYYLIQETEAGALSLVYVLMETEKAVFLELENGSETQVWKKKSDTIAEIVEELTEEQADEYESIMFEDDDEDEDFEWDDDDEGVIPIHN